MKQVFYIMLFLLPVSLLAQEKATATLPSYPQDYFRNPLDIPIFLAGNFGECRPGHFHSGVDIKTLGKENQPVHAAADGYISRIKMEKGGFGHGIYITHPNGYTTLYAHLNDFVPELQKYMKKDQYEKKHWDVDIQLSPDQFPVKKGQQIAWSGNTGASTAPHLHFEIRNTKTEHPLNPELFGLPIVDNVAPVPAEVVFFLGGNAEYSTVLDNTANLDKNFRYTIPVQKAVDAYKLYNKKGYGKVNSDTVDVEFINGTIGIGINVDDYMDGSDNTIAFYTAKLLMDDTLQTEITLDNIGYDETRYINAYADYPSKEKDHKWVQCLFKLPGNHLDAIYTYLNAQSGNLRITDMKPHKIDIIIADDKGNKSAIKFYLRNPQPEINFGGWKCTMYDVNTTNKYESPNINFQLDDKELYDKVCMRVDQLLSPKTISDKYKVGDPWIPVHHYFDLQIKPNKPIPFALRSKVVIMYSDDKDEDGRATTFEDNGWYKAKVRDFGTYWLDIDTTAPVIKSLQKNGANLSKVKQITFEVKDAATSVKAFSGYLDGKWICFEQHGSSFFYKFDEHCSKGKHKLVFKAEDENGNAAVYNLGFTR